MCENLSEGQKCKSPLIAICNRAEKKVHLNIYSTLPSLYPIYEKEYYSPFAQGLFLCNSGMTCLKEVGIFGTLLILLCVKL